jgi:hypothetical protein
MLVHKPFLSPYLADIFSIFSSEMKNISSNCKWMGYETNIHVYNAWHQEHTYVLIYFLSHTVTCADHPCEHGGVCSANGESYSCSCRAGYSGSNCEIIGNDV